MSDAQSTDEHVDRHDPADFAGWLRVRASENRRVAELPAEQWPKRPALLWHLALRFEQGAELVDEMRGEIEQLRRDVAIQTVNAKTVTDLQERVKDLQQFHDWAQPFIRPSHEREPPHCSTCSCGVGYDANGSPVVDGPSGCHRSHPHENMSAECERLTEIARRNAHTRNGDGK
jgi:hypothetical protein